tara:strand:+ start:39 stop:791 length:753 start_codon:yes stop_codon:yes gene_type:complete
MDEKWDLFGLNKEKSSLQDAKKAYFNLALMVHPDKNPGISCEEMHVVIKGYNDICDYIKKRDLHDEIESCNDLKKYREEEIKKFDEDIRDIPSFMDIYYETHENMKDFNKIWDKNKTEELFHMSRPEGYKLCESEYANLNNIVENIEYDPKISNIGVNIKNVEKENKNNIIGFSCYNNQNNNALLSNERPNNFSIDKTACDYGDAFTNPSLLHEILPENTINYFSEKNLVNKDKINERYENMIYEYNKTI